MVGGRGVGERPVPWTLNERSSSQLALVQRVWQICVQRDTHLRRGLPRRPESARQPPTDPGGGCVVCIIPSRAPRSFPIRTSRALLSTIYNKPRFDVCRYLRATIVSGSWNVRDVNYARSCCGFLKIILVHWITIMSTVFIFLSRSGLLGSRANFKQVSFQSHGQFWSLRSATWLSWRGQVPLGASGIPLCWSWKLEGY